MAAARTLSQNRNSRTQPGVAPLAQAGGTPADHLTCSTVGPLQAWGTPPEGWARTGPRQRSLWRAALGLGLGAEFLAQVESAAQPGVRTTTNPIQLALWAVSGHVDVFATYASLVDVSPAWHLPNTTRFDRDSTGRWLVERPLVRPARLCRKWLRSRSGVP